MADIFQFVSTDEDDNHYDEILVDEGHWHASYFSDCVRSLCGMQCDGDDGYAPGPKRKGRVTCPSCRDHIKQIRAIKNW